MWCFLRLWQICLYAVEEPPRKKPISGILPFGLGLEVSLPRKSVEVDKKGRIVIPKFMREKLGIRAGSVLMLHLVESRGGYKILVEVLAR